MACQKYMEFLCDLDDEKSAIQPSTPTSSPSTSSLPTVSAQTPQSLRRNLHKVGAALRTWKEELQFYESRKENRKAEIRETKTEIYQLVGFYTVVQGILFQGVSSMNMERIGSCSKIFGLSATLSVLSSVATIVVTGLKLRDLYGLIGQLSDAQRTVQALEHLIKKVQTETTAFDWSHTEGDFYAEKTSAATHLIRAIHPPKFAIVVTLLLLGFSAIFPIAFHEILC